MLENIAHCKRVKCNELFIRRFRSFESSLTQVLTQVSISGIKKPNLSLMSLREILPGNCDMFLTSAGYTYCVHCITMHCTVLYLEKKVYYPDKGFLGKGYLPQRQMGNIFPRYWGKMFLLIKKNSLKNIPFFISTSVHTYGMHTYTRW
jgi:hypothetical protein